MRGVGGLRQSNLLCGPSQAISSESNIILSSRAKHRARHRTLSARYYFITRGVARRGVAGPFAARSGQPFSERHGDTRGRISARSAVGHEDGPRWSLTSNQDMDVADVIDMV